MPEPTLQVHLDPADLAASLRADVRRGLSGVPRWLPPKWFYDARGSELFEKITELPEYYPTRAEREVLTAHAAEIAELTGAWTLVELGSGSSEKTRLLLDALTVRGALGMFVPMDVSEAALATAVAVLAADYPHVFVHGVVGDFTRHLDRVPGHGGRRLVAFLGGTIGNLLPAERAEFLVVLRATLDAGEWLLLGADLVKDPDTLVAAYDDRAGVTAEFNRNVLRVLNRELGADFEPDAFAHVARWNAEREWIEMWLRATRPARVRIPGVDLVVDFGAGEELCTEISAKFRPDGLRTELGAAGFAVRRWWTDRAGRFAVLLAQAV